MRTLGVDLAAQPKSTASCDIDWDTGCDRVVEVYPAAALRRWGLELAGYERTPEARGRIAAAIAAALPGLAVAAWDSTLRASADVLDALVASLVCRAKLLGLVDPLPPEHASAALAEGWTWVPQSDALSRLR